MASGAQYIIVKAGPGTGKTHTLVQRVVRLVHEDNTPCTVITFTNRAADELRQRLERALGPDIYVFVGTLHAYCLHWLRRQNQELKVAGPEKRKLLLLAVWPEASADELVAFDREITFSLRAASAAEKIHLSRYFARLNEEGLIDIDEVVPATLALLRQDDAAAAEMRQGTGQLLLDEFQDLNESQYQLVSLLASTSPVFAIGDPDQAIYGFRGSSPAWFYRFARELQAEQHTLWRNYRSGSTIVAAAAAVITHNSHPEEQGRNEAVSGLPGSLYVFRADSAGGEAAFIVRQIEALIGGSSHREVERLKPGAGDVALGDIAVLYRTGRQAEILAAALIDHGFPVQVVDVVPFYLAGSASLLYLWVLLAAGQAESTHLLDLLQREPGVGRATLARVEQELAGVVADPWASLVRGRGKVPPQARTRLDEMTVLLRSVQDVAAAQGIVQALRLVSGRYGINDKEDDIARLLRLADNFGSSLGDFAGHLQRYRDSVVYDERADVVTLLTLHASKGLEFRVVFLAGVEEGLLPLALRRQLTVEAEAEHLEEERRLCYVGMTRARETLYLSHARIRSVDGRSINREPSRFIGEIPGELVAATGEARIKKSRKRVGLQLSLFDQS